MSYVEKSLLPEEKILYRTGKHPIIFFVPAVWVILTAGFLLVPNDLVHKIAFVPALAALFTGFNQWLIYITAEFAVTSRRIIMREGFFFRHMNEMRLSTVSNMTVNQSILGQLLGYGTLVVSPFGSNNDIFTAISHPFVFQRTAQEQLDRVMRPPGIVPPSPAA